MSKKKLVTLISVIVAVAAAVTAIVVFHKQIAAFFGSVSARLKKTESAREPQPDFTDEERESFADI